MLLVWVNVTPKTKRAMSEHLVTIIKHTLEFLKSHNDVVTNLGETTNYLR